MIPLLTQRNNWMVDYFKDDDVFIVGGGPSLSGFDFSKLLFRNIIAINNAYAYLSSDIVVFLDPGFKKHLFRNGDTLDDINSLVVTGSFSGVKESDNVFIVQESSYVSKRPDYLFNYRNSALIALNIALIAGARNIYLLGIDGHCPNGHCHFYCDEKSPCSPNTLYAERAPGFADYYKYGNVFTLTPSVYDFPMRELSEVL